MELLDRAFPKQPQKIIDIETEEIKDDFDKGISKIVNFPIDED